MFFDIGDRELKELLKQLLKESEKLKAEYESEENQDRKLLLRILSEIHELHITQNIQMQILTKLLVRVVEMSAGGMPEDEKKWFERALEEQKKRKKWFER